MIHLRGTLPDLEDHAIERLLAGLSLSNAERAAYDMWSDGMSGKRDPMTVAEKRLVINIVADTAHVVIENKKAAKVYAHARAHNKVMG